MEPDRRLRRLTTVDWPFLGSEALAAGLLNRYQLATRYDAVYRNVYVPRGRVLTPAQKAHAAWLWAQRGATMVSVSAAALHGSKWIDERLPAELNQRSQHKTRGIVLHNDSLAADEVGTVRGLPVTTVARTAFDLGRRYGRTLAVIRVDALLQATSLKQADVETLIERHRGARGDCPAARSSGTRRRGRGVAPRDPDPSRAHRCRTAAVTHPDRCLRLRRPRRTHRYGLARVESRRGVRRRTTLDRSRDPGC